MGAAPARAERLADRLRRLATVGYYDGLLGLVDRVAIEPTRDSALGVGRGDLVGLGALRGGALLDALLFAGWLVARALADIALGGGRRERRSGRGISQPGQRRMGPPRRAGGTPGGCGGAFTPQPTSRRSRTSARRTTASVDDAEVGTDGLGGLRIHLGAVDPKPVQAGQRKSTP